jgi:flagellar capping protein FliD
LAFAVSGRAVTSANIGGAADGSDNGTVTISGTTLTVTSASGAAGLQLDYNSTAAASAINLNFTVGVGAALFNIADPALDPINGSVQTEINSLNDADTQTQTRITTLQSQVDAYRQTLVTRFAATESQLASTSSLLSSIIQAFNSVSNNSNN